MQALLQNTDPPRPGHALLVLSQIKKYGLPADAGIIVQRAADRQFLDKSGWQDIQANLSPLMARYDDSGEELLLTIGPEVVDYLIAGQDYRLYLSWPEQPLQIAGLKIEDINYSTLKRSKDEIEAIQARERHDQDDEQEMAPNNPQTTPAPFPSAPEPVATDRHESNQPLPAQEPDSPAKRDEAPTTPRLHESADYQQEQEQHSVGSVLNSAIILIGVMSLIAILLYFFL